MYILLFYYDFIVLTPEMENKVFAGFEAGEYDVPLVDNVRNGKGTQKLKKDGVEYTLECTWKDGKKNGEGVLLDNNYVMAMKLNFVDDVAEGEGYLYTNGQVTFKGNWKNGLRCGLCQEYAGGHLVYKGEYADDQRNGYGILYDENQEIVFEGQWVNGEQGLISISENDHGDREMTEKKENGCIQYIGGYKEGTLLRDGKGVEYDDDGKPVSECIYHEGVIERKIKEFKGNNIVMYDAKGMKVYEGEYLKDTAHRYPPNGKGRLFNGTVMIYNGDFVKGKREGHGCSYHLTRCLQYEGDWMNDMANGLGNYYDEQGNLIVSGEFHDNMFTDDNRCIHVDTGVIDNLNKGGCGCFGGNRRAKTKQLPSIYYEEEEENSSSSNKKAVKNMKELNALPVSTTVLTIASDSFNEEEIISLDLYRFEHLRRLVIGDNSLHHLKQLNIREMKYLKSIEIGNRSCSIPELSAKMDKEYTIKANDHCMYIESCPVLEEIILGDGSCADFVKFSLIGKK